MVRLTYEVSPCHEQGVLSAVIRACQEKKKIYSSFFAFDD